MRRATTPRRSRSAGPPEIRQELRGSQRAGRNARSQLSQDNRSLLRRMVSLQDDERRDLARELHDELGPLLFGIRANTMALLDASPPGGNLGGAGAGHCCSRSKRCSRPTAASSTGCGRSTSRNWVWRQSMQTLLQNVEGQAPAINVTSRSIRAERGRRSAGADNLSRDPGGVTNVLRHARANSNAHVQATHRRREVDRGDIRRRQRLSRGQMFGRGLTGMHGAGARAERTLNCCAKKAGPACVAGFPRAIPPAREALHQPASTHQPSWRVLPRRRASGALDLGVALKR